MVDVLENKRAATRFRILVAIAQHQPAVSQGEIADAVGVTSQAVSEYVRALIEEGYVEKEGRSRYRVTKEGVDWVFQSATDMRRFVDHVTDDILGSVQEEAALATGPVEAGQTVSLSLSAGLLRAAPGDDGGATGVTTSSAAEGEVVGITGFEGVMDLEPGHVSIVQVPTVRTDDDIDPAAIADRCADVPVVTAAGVEAVDALRRADVEPTTYFAPGEVAADAATRGLDAVVIATQDTVGRVTDALRDTSVSYDVTK